MVFSFDYNTKTYFLLYVFPESPYFSLSALTLVPLASF